jgi:tellurite resistance protein TehA-like permease
MSVFCKQIMALWCVAFFAGMVALSSGLSLGRAVEVMLLAFSLGFTLLACFRVLCDEGCWWPRFWIRGQRVFPAVEVQLAEIAPGQVAAQAAGVPEDLVVGRPVRLLLLV